MGLLGSTPSLRGAGESVPIMIINPHEAPGEGEYLAEGDEDAAVYHPRRRDTYPCCEQCAPEGAQCHGEEQLPVRRHRRG